MPKTAPPNAYPRGLHAVYRGRTVKEPRAFERPGKQPMVTCRIAVKMAAPSAPRDDHNALTEWVNVIAFTERTRHLLMQCDEGNARRDHRKRDQGVLHEPRRRPRHQPDDHRRRHPLGRREPPARRRPPCRYGPRHQDAAHRLAAGIRAAAGRRTAGSRLSGSTEIRRNEDASMQPARQRTRVPASRIGGAHGDQPTRQHRSRSRRAPPRHRISGPGGDRKSRPASADDAHATDQERDEVHRNIVNDVATCDGGGDRNKTLLVQVTGARTLRFATSPTPKRLAIRGRSRC